MKYSVVLQEPFDFARTWLVAGGALLLAAVVLFLAHRFLLRDRARRRVNVLRAIRLFYRKRRSLRSLGRIQRDFDRRRLDSRAAYQSISGEVRRFAQQVTGRPVTHLSHGEFKQLGYPPLAELMEDLCALEFARTPRQEIGDTIQKSKELIRKWQ